MAARILIVAYGNPLRGDDGVAWHVAELLRGELSPDEAEILCVHQLMPELAESVSRSSGTIFIDARENGEPGQIYQARVAQQAETSFSTHVLTPAQVMALADALYGNRPEAYELSVPGESFLHSEELSPTLKSALPQMVEAVHHLTTQLQRKTQP